MNKSYCEQGLDGQDAGTSCLRAVLFLTSTGRSFKRAAKLTPKCLLSLQVVTPPVAGLSPRIPQGLFEWTPNSSRGLRERLGVDRVCKTSGPSCGNRLKAGGRAYPSSKPPGAPPFLSLIDWSPWGFHLTNKELYTHFKPTIIHLRRVFKVDFRRDCWGSRKFCWPSERWGG